MQIIINLSKVNDSKITMPQLVDMVKQTLVNDDKTTIKSLVNSITVTTPVNTDLININLLQTLATIEGNSINNIYISLIN